MMDTIKRWFAGFFKIWAGLKLWQRASLFLAAFLVLGGVVALILFAGKMTYDPLFAGLDVSDQAAIVDYLKEHNIPYKLDQGSNAILLPQTNVYETRLALAQEGLPRGGNVGFELFDNSSAGMSEFQQKIAYTRAIEGELSRTIKQMDAVESARVSVVIPEQRLFLEQQQPSTASVLLRMRPGASIGPVQVKSIIHLVSHSVDGLLPEDVTVVDTNGRNLSDMISDPMFVYGQDGANSVTSIQRELERQHERELESKLRAMLEQVFGPGSAVVRVKVELDFDKRSNSLVEYTPNPDTGQGIQRSSERGEETYSGQGQPVTGTPGTTTNIPGYAINTQNVNSDYSKSNTTVNYEITTRKIDQVYTPGSVRRISTSVLIDSELNEEGLTDIREVIASAMGFSQARGDSLAVKAMRFSTAFADSMAEQMRQERLVKIAWGSIIGLVLLAIAIGVLIWWLRRRRAQLAAALAVQEESKKVPTIQELLTSPDLMAFQGEMAVIEEQLKAYARNHPEEVASLVNEWLSVED